MLYLITWLTDFAAFLLIFTVPRLLAEQEADAFMIGLIGTMFSAVSVFSNAISGRLSDRHGRRIVATTGTMLLFLSICGVTWLQPGRWSYYVSFAVAGGSLGIIYPALIAWIGHGRSDKHASRAFLGFCLAFNLGMISGQLVGGWLFQYWGLQPPLYLAMALVATSLVLLSRFRADSIPQLKIASKDEIRQSSRVALSAAFSRVCWIVNIGGTFSMSIVFYLLPKLLVELNIPANEHGTMLAIGRTVVIGTFLSMHVSSFWHHRLSMSLATQIFGVFGLFGLAVSTTLVGLTIGLASLSVLLGYNYFSSVYYSNTGSADHRKGTASGMHEATLALGLTTGSLFGGVAGSYFGNRAPFLLAAAVITALAVVQIVAYRRLVHPLFQQQAAEAFAQQATPASETGGVF